MAFLFENFKNQLKRFPVVYNWVYKPIDLIRRIRKHGFVSVPTYLVVKKIEMKMESSNQKQSNVICPCCDWHGKCFFPLDLKTRYRVSAKCPRCGSRERTRAYFLYYYHIEKFPKVTKTILMVSEEPRLKNYLFKDYKGFLINCDIRPVDVTLRADLTKLSLKNECADVVLCHHVLEHILNDRDAIEELKRVTKFDGIVYISVPQNYDLDKTVEWGKANARMSCHVREYGKDFIERLGCFTVEVIDVATFWGFEQRKKWGLDETEILYKCTKGK